MGEVVQGHHLNPEIERYIINLKIQSDLEVQQVDSHWQDTALGGFVYICTETT